MVLFDANIINFVSNPSMVPVKCFQKTPLGTPRPGVPKQIIRFHRPPPPCTETVFTNTPPPFWHAKT